jgi:prophage regulatory protein
MEVKVDIDVSALIAKLDKIIGMQKSHSTLLKPLTTRHHYEDPEPHGPRLLRLKQDPAITGLSRSTIYLHQANGTFPKSKSLGDRSVAWFETDILDWVQSRP